MSMDQHASIEIFDYARHTVYWAVSILGEV